MDLETVNKLYLELSQFATAKKWSGGFDLSAGMFGTHVSEWLREVAKELEHFSPK